MVNPGTAITSIGSSCIIVVLVNFDILLPTDVNNDCINDITMVHTNICYILFDAACDYRISQSRVEKQTTPHILNYPEMHLYYIL